MAKHKPKTPSSTKQNDIDFLNSLWPEIVKYRHDIGLLSPCDFPEPSEDSLKTSDEYQRCARLANHYGLDGNVFMEIDWPYDDNDIYDITRDRKNCRGKIEMILEIIDKIESGDGGGQQSKEDIPSQKKEKLQWLAEAMLIVKDHPDWSDRRIANEVGVDPSTLSRGPEYQIAAELARPKKKSDTMKGFVTVDPETGSTQTDGIYKHDFEINESG